MPPMSSLQSATPYDIALLNPSFLCILLTGCYTSVFFSAVNAHITQQVKANRHILAAIILMYSLNVVQTSMQWWYWQILPVGDEIGFFTLASIMDPLRTKMGTRISDLCLLLVSVLADTLLIWRCYHVWNRSVTVIILPMILTGLQIVTWTAWEICIWRGISVTQAGVVLSNLAVAGQALGGGAAMLNFVTTTLTTWLIVHRIKSVAIESGSHMQHSQNKLRRTSDLLVQSAAGYAVMSFLFAISEVILGIQIRSPRTSRSLRLFQAYSCTLYACAGIFPTMMVFRIYSQTSSLSIKASEPSQIIFSRRRSADTEADRSEETASEQGGT